MKEKTPLSICNCNDFKSNNFKRNASYYSGKLKTEVVGGETVLSQC